MRTTFFLIGILFVIGGFTAPIIDKQGTADMAVGVPPKIKTAASQAKKVTYFWSTKEYSIVMKTAAVIGGGILIYLALHSPGEPDHKAIRRWVRKRKKARHGR